MPGLTRHPIFNTEKLDRGSWAAMTTRLLRQPFFILSYIYIEQ